MADKKATGAAKATTDRFDANGRPVGLGGAMRARAIDSYVDAAVSGKNSNARLKNAQTTDSNN